MRVLVRQASRNLIFFSFQFMEISHNQRKGNSCKNKNLVISSFCFNPLTVPTVLFRALLDNWSAASLTCNIQYARYNKYVLAYCGVSILGRTTCVGRIFLFLFVSFFCVPYSFVVPLCFTLFSLSLLSLFRFSR